MEFVSLVIPQVPGSIRRSRPIRGISESVLKAKKYVIPLAFFQPYVAGGFAAAYLVNGQFKPNKNAMDFNSRFFDASVEVDQLGSEVSMTDKTYVHETIKIRMSAEESRETISAPDVTREGRNGSEN